MIGVPIILTVRVSHKFISNAANCFLTNHTIEKVTEQIKNILINEAKSLMAKVTIKEINTYRGEFIWKIKNHAEPELNKMGFTITDIHTVKSPQIKHVKELIPFF